MVFVGATNRSLLGLGALGACSSRPLRATTALSLSLPRSRFRSRQARRRPSAERADRCTAAASSLVARHGRTTVMAAAALRWDDKDSFLASGELEDLEAVLGDGDAHALEQVVVEVRRVPGLQLVPAEALFV